MSQSDERVSQRGGRKRSNQGKAALHMRGGTSCYLHEHVKPSRTQSEGCTTYDPEVLREQSFALACRCRSPCCSLSSLAQGWHGHV